MRSKYFAARSSSAPRRWFRSANKSGGVSKMFNGALTALVTPFRDGAVDETALRELIEWQIQSGIDGLVPCGSTGESATLSHAEHDKVIKLTVEQTRKRVPVIAGTGSNSTAEAIRLTAAAREMGADGALLLSPYYNKPTQDGIYRHYKTIASSVDLPLFVYNIPGRTASNVLPETVARLAEIKHSVGLDGSVVRHPENVRRSDHDSVRRRRAHAAADGARREGRHLDLQQHRSARDARARGGRAR